MIGKEGGLGGDKFFFEEGEGKRKSLTRRRRKERERARYENMDSMVVAVG